MSNKELVELAQMLAKRYVKLVHELLGSRLVSAALFGSLATGRFNEESDIDVFLVVEDFSGKSVGSRIWTLMPALESLRKTEEYEIWRKKIGKTIPDISPIVYTPEEVKKHPPLMLDLVYDAQILYDNGFLTSELEALKKKLEEIGARRIKLPDGSWYWQLSQKIKRGETIEV